MNFDDKNLANLKKTADSYLSLVELTDRLQSDYQELSNKFENQSLQLERINSQLTDAVAINSQLSSYLNNIMEHLDAGIIVVDENGQINLFNGAAENLTGINRQNALARQYRELFSGDEHKPTFDLLNGSEFKVRGEKWFGNQPVGYSANRISGLDGEYCGVVEILYNLSSEKKLRETISHVSALAAIGEMAATVAHQVRNPLAGIIGFTDLLRRDLVESGHSLKLVDKISRGSRELNRIITSLLDYTKKTEPDYRELDIVKFIRETVDTLEKESFAADVRFTYDFKLKALTYRFDPLLLHQAISNIVHNACQAMEPNPGSLRITVRKTDDSFLEIAFADTGKGINSDDSRKLFQPFYTTRSDGVGLGLSMVKKAVDFHNGVVTAFNQESGGAVFMIKLPL